MLRFGGENKERKESNKSDLRFSSHPGRHGDGLSPTGLTLQTLKLKCEPLQALLWVFGQQNLLYSAAP